MPEQEQCVECGRKATDLVNDIAPVCEHHAKEASLNGWLVAPIGADVEDTRYYHLIEQTKEVS